VYQKRGEDEAANHALTEAQRIVAEMNGSKFSWWHDHLLFLIVLEEVRKELGSTRG
jgi:hypothetical protein